MTALRWPRSRWSPSRLWVRLAFGFGALLLLMLVLVALSIWQFRSLSRQVEQVTGHDLQRMLRTQQIFQHAQGHGSVMARLLTAPRSERELIYPVGDAEYASVERLLTDLNTLMPDGESSRQLKAITVRGREYREVFTRVGELLETGQAQSARALFNDTGQPALRALMDAANEMLAHEQLAMQSKRGETRAQINRSEWLLASLALGALVLSVVFAWRTTMSVARPLQRVEDAANRIAGGDYTATVEVRQGDELSRVTHAFNAMSHAVASREAQIERLAYTDRLTGLPNRTKLRDLFQPVLAGHLSVILMDIARLRTVNEVLGFDIGDALIASVADRLQQVISDFPVTQTDHTHPVLARLSGGVFAVLLLCDDRSALERLRERIDGTIGAPMACEGHEIDVQLVYGLAEAGAADTSVEALLRCGETALGNAKQSKLLWMWFQQVEDSSRVRQLSLLSELRHAARSGELEMWLQPKNCLRTGRIVGMEALVRWRHPVRGLVAPGEFIPFAERTGHISVVTHAMIRAALSRLIEWRSTNPDLTIAVNVSALDIQDPTFVDQIKQHGRDLGAPLDRLRLEITESSVMEETGLVLPILHALRRIGVQLSIDDFGTGYSSLSYLHRLPVSELKIDRSFVTNADFQDEAQALLRTIIDLGHSLNMIVTAEGIEREQEFALLKQLGCDVAQGYLISPPLDREATQRYLKSLASDSAKSPSV